MGQTDAARLGLAEETLGSDESTITARFIEFLKTASARRYPTGTIHRFNQGRHAGCVEAEFTVLDNLAADLRTGLFAQPRSYPARVRFASATAASDRERDTRGMSIQVRDVAGENLTPGATTHDFVLNSHPVMIAPNPGEFLELLQALEAGGFAAAGYFLSHPKAAITAARARARPACHLDMTYWSTTPYLFGPGRAVKYIVRPVASTPVPLSEPLTDTSLRDALRTRLASAASAFDFLVQFRVAGRDMPIEDASVEWEEKDSPYRAVARLTIPRQAIDTTERETFCETVAFNPWHCLADHRPLGSMNRARRDIYPALAQFRASRAAAPQT